MAFSSIPIAQIVTDVSHYTASIWRQLRDNLDGHTHANGQGKKIGYGGIAAGHVTGAKMANGSVLSKHYLPSFSQVKVATGDLSLPSSGSVDDSSLSISFSMPVSVIAEIHYQAYRFAVSPG